VSPTGRHFRGPAIVTGGGQGLGRTFAEALAGQGVPVAVADLDGANAERVASHIAGRGGQAIGLEVDVSDAGSVESLAAAVRDQLGLPAILVNNAAVFSTLAMSAFTQISLEEWTRVLNVNVTGPFLCARAVIADMAKQGYGKIVNISSTTVFLGRPNYLHYVTSKAAVIGMTRALASEVGPFGITVNAIAPGSTETEVERATITHADRERLAATSALQRVQVPEDLVGALLFLTSADSDFVTGQTLIVDGGISFN
jgi:3-oxoacyl-[acyl-carrier protein] reductase